MIKLTRNDLRRLILEELISEIPRRGTHRVERNPLGTPSYHGKDPYKVYFAARKLFSEYSPVYHAWVMLIGPEGYKSLSGKSGAAFTASQFLEIDWDELAAEGVVSDWIQIGRDEGPDAVWAKAKQNAAIAGTEEAYEAVKQALQNTTWKNLQKRENWSSDGYHKADVKVYIPPPLGMTGRDFHYRLQAAYNGYQENVPYDPAPELSLSNPSARNSNSFAFSLIKTAWGGTPPELARLFDKLKYPGSSEHLSFEVPVAKPNPDLKLPAMSRGTRAADVKKQSTSTEPKRPMVADLYPNQ